MASHVVLEEAGVEYCAHRVDIFSGEHMEPAYKLINPRSKLPALQLDDGNVLVESTAILTWIARTHPDKPLLGMTEFDQARCISICSWLSSTVHPAFARIVRPDRFADDKQSQAALQKKAKATYWELLQEIDQMLADKPWLMGDHFTVCDPYALVFLSWAPELELPYGELKNYIAMKDRVLARPLARKALEREENRLLTM
jgi:glutathione S-transferase